MWHSFQKSNLLCHSPFIWCSVAMLIHNSPVHLPSNEAKDENAYRIQIHGAARLRQKNEFPFPCADKRNGKTRCEANRTASDVQHEYLFIIISRIPCPPILVLSTFSFFQRSTAIAVVVVVFVFCSSVCCAGVLPHHFRRKFFSYWNPKHHTENDNFSTNSFFLSLDPFVRCLHLKLLLALRCQLQLIWNVSMPHFCHIRFKMVQQQTTPTIHSLSLDWRREWEKGQVRRWIVLCLNEKLL